jgi:beta-phosphoglucomutase
MKELQGVLFDWDGVLVDTMPQYASAWREAFASVGITGIPDREWYLREGQPREICIAEVFYRYKGNKIDSGTLAQVSKTKHKLFCERYEPRMFSGVLDLLQLLKAQGIRCAVVTGSRSLVTKQAVTRLIPNLLNGAVFGVPFGLGKPEPEPYLAGLAELRLQPINCMAVENGPLGIRSARAAELRCVALKGPVLDEECLYSAGANAVFNSHAELRSYFADLLTQDQQYSVG